ncbi:MAG: orotidine-5'-phosphate decarboxylase [Herpetosiphonaceae bacterium]|nr:orotidine-5'-phosphate decarboxylase [Herpetosiphonaceae bacterium]
MQFFARIEQLSEQKRSLLCVGLDPDPRKLPAWTSDDPDPVFAFNRHIIDLTCDLVIAYKPNAAFYEALGPHGWQTLADTIKYAHQCGVPVILDAKRGDIGSSATAYATAAFQQLGADAITVSPYMGWDSVEPFVRYAERGVFVLALTSNPGAQDFQCADSHGHPLYQRVAEQCTGWNERGNVGLVVGATYADDICCVRSITADQWLLLPGIGAQGGDLHLALENGLRSDGSGVLVNVGRAVLYADDPREAAMQLRDEIETIRAAKRASHQDCATETKQRADHPNLTDLALALYDQGAIQFGDFTLHSGVQSPFYIDLRLLVSNPHALAMAARAYVDLLDNLFFDRLAGIPYAGLPLATAVALQTCTPLIYPRKEAKPYGTGRIIEGTFEPDETIVVIDDLISNGASKITAIEPLEAAGLRVHDVVVLLDREGSGREELAKAGYTLHSVFRLHELVDILLEHGRIVVEQHELVTHYLNNQPLTPAV